MPLLGWSDEQIYTVSRRAHALHEQGRYADAAQIFAGLRTLDPENLYLHEAFATSLLAARQAEQALMVLDDLLLRASRRGDMATQARIRTRRASALLDLGRREDAVAEVARLRSAPVNALSGLIPQLELRLRAARL